MIWMAQEKWLEGRKFVNENFDVKKMVDDIDMLYDAFINNFILPLKI